MVEAMRPRRHVAAGVLLASLALAACGTAIEDRTQTVTVLTEPPGAACTLLRAGATLAVARPTPARVSLERSGETVAVLCRKDGHFDSVGVLPVRTGEGPPGTLRIGAIVTVEVDIPTGRTHAYPETVTVVLTPKTFATAAGRDAFFARERTRIVREADEAAAELRRTCAGEPRDCETLADGGNRARDAALRRLEKQRAATRVGGTLE